MTSKVDFFSVEDLLEFALLKLLILLPRQLANLINARFFIEVTIDTHVLATCQWNNVDLIGQLFSYFLDDLCDLRVCTCAIDYKNPLILVEVGNLPLLFIIIDIQSSFHGRCLRWCFFGVLHPKKVFKFVGAWRLGFLRSNFLRILW